jgi:hypothetical protein
VAAGRRLGSAVCVLASDSACAGGVMEPREWAARYHLLARLIFFRACQVIILLTEKRGALKARVRSGAILAGVAAHFDRPWRSASQSTRNAFCS